MYKPAPPLYFIHIEELRSGRTIVATLFEERLMPLLRKDGEIGSKIVVADDRRYWALQPEAPDAA